MRPARRIGRRLLLVGLLLLLCAGALLERRRAHAFTGYSCCACEEGQLTILPAPGVDLPTNGHVWILEPDELQRPIRVFDASNGADVAARVDVTSVASECGEVRRLHEIVPLQPLRAHTRYSFGIISFETSSDAVLSPPPIPEGRIAYTFQEGLFARDRGLHHADGVGTFARIALNSDAPIVVLEKDGQRMAELTHDGRARMVLGSNACFRGLPLARGETAVVRWGAYDLAGHFSGWSEPVTLSMPWWGAGDLELLVIAALGLGGVGLVAFGALRRRA